MNLSIIAEQTGSSFLVSSASAFLLNALCNRRIDRKIMNAAKSGGNHAKNTLLHNIVIKTIESNLGRTPVPLFASFLSGCMFANKNSYKESCKDGLWSAVNTYFTDKLYKKIN